MGKRVIRAGQVVLVLLALSPVCRGQHYAPGNSNYALERWDEDYSYLQDPANRTDFFDPIKYMPISKDGKYYLSLGGQARYRYDYFNNPSFGPGTNDEDGWHLERFLLHLDAHFGEHLRTFVQVDSSLVQDRVGGPRVGDVNDFDLQQGFVDLMTGEHPGFSAYLRLGRQELVYGAERFISPDDWRNVRRSFDGAKLSVAIPNDTAELFVTRPVLVDKSHFDDNDSGTVFSGIYNVTALPDLIEHAGSKIDLYFLSLDQTRGSPTHVDADTYTAGARFYTHPKPFDADIEGNYQFGEYESASISAWSIATEVGFTFEPVPFSPRASLGLDIASGSPAADGRFNQLFPPTYMYLGHVYLFGRPNLVDVHAGLDFELTKAVTLFTAEHVFWRQNINDGLYNLSGAQIRADNGSDAAYVGNEFDVGVDWQINRHFSAYAGWGHFFSGDFISQTGPSMDVDFVYASVTFTF